jgi:hypothetical protein
MATNPFANVGLSQFGQELSDGGSKNGIGNFILGAALTSLGMPKEVTSLVTKDKGVAPPVLPNLQGSIPAAVVPGQPMQNPDDERNSFSQGFQNFFSHLPTFGNK